MSLAVDIALRAGLVTSQLRGLSGAHGDSSSWGRGGLGSSHDGEEAGEKDGETHGDGSEGFSFVGYTKRRADTGGRGVTSTRTNVGDGPKRRTSRRTIEMMKKKERKREEKKSSCTPRSRESPF